jgi:hypothetical protein
MPMPIKAGRPARFDYENRRNGTANLSLLSPVSADAGIHRQKRSQLDRLYQRVVDDLDALMGALGLKAA